MITAPTSWLCSVLIREITTAVELVLVIEVDVGVCFSVTTRYIYRKSEECGQKQE